MIWAGWPRAWKGEPAPHLFSFTQSVAIVTEAESQGALGVKQAGGSLCQAERTTANADLRTLLPAHSYYFLFTSLFLLKEEVSLWDLPTGWAGF